MNSRCHLTWEWFFLAAGVSFFSEARPSSCCHKSQNHDTCRQDGRPRFAGRAAANRNLQEAIVEIRRNSRPMDNNDNNQEIKCIMGSESEAEEDYVATAETQNEGDEFHEDETSNSSTQHQVDEVNYVNAGNEAKSNGVAEDEDDDVDNNEARADAVNRHRPRDDNNTNESSIKRPRSAKMEGIQRTAKMLNEAESNGVAEDEDDDADNNEARADAVNRHRPRDDNNTNESSTKRPRSAKMEGIQRTAKMLKHEQLSPLAGTQARDGLRRHCQEDEEDGEANLYADEKDKGVIGFEKSDGEDSDSGTPETRKASTAETKDYALDRDELLVKFTCAIKENVLAEISSARFELGPPEGGGGGQSLYWASGNKEKTIVHRQNSREIPNQKVREYIDAAESQGENFVELWNNALANEGSSLQIKGFETRMEERGKKKKMTKVTYFAVHVVDTSTPSSNRVSLMSLASEPQNHPRAPVKLTVSRQILMGPTSQNPLPADTSGSASAGFEAEATSSSTSSSSCSARDRHTEESHPSFANSSTTQQIRLLRERLEEEEKKRKKAEAEADRVHESRAETERLWEQAKKERNAVLKERKYYQQKYEQEKKKREELQQEVQGMLDAIHILHGVAKRFKQEHS